MFRSKNLLYCIRNFSKVATSVVSKQPNVMKVSEEQLTQILRPSVQKLTSLFAKHNYELRVAGGAVRDLLLGLNPDDLDFATTATPQQMIEMFCEESVRMLQDNGLKHGTVTVRIDEENFECTTLRIDTKTDGRHAEVQFTTDWYLDASRRDLTINSMFLGMDGTVYDFYNGSTHLQEKRIVFVGDPNDRIKEDYLRILRYFRFYGKVAENSNEHLEDVIEAVKRNVEGLSRISGERIWIELKKIVSGNFCGAILEKMVECGVAPHIGLPEDYSGEACTRLLHNCYRTGISQDQLEIMTVLAAGFTRLEQAESFIARIRCSKKEREILVTILKERESFSLVTDTRAAKRLLTDHVVLMKEPLWPNKAKIIQLFLYVCKPELAKEFENWKHAEFPVPGGEIAKRVDNKRKIGHINKELYTLWRDSDYTMTAEQLVALIDEIQANVEIPTKSRKMSK